MPELDRFKEELLSVWESQILTNGGNKEKLLESKLSQFLKTPCLSLFNNGTIGLMTAIKALNLAGEVITTPFTFPATPHVLSWNNLKPVFCDIDPSTMNIDPKKIEEKITDKTSAILGVHVFGVPCAVNEIERIAKKHSLRVIYDGAHAFGVEINGRSIATFGDLTMFSFHATKLFHTGEGGAIACNDALLKEKIDLLKNFGIKNEEEVLLAGTNGKMNEVQAALGLVNLSLIEREWLSRKEIIEAYRNELHLVPGIEMMKMSENVRTSMQYMPIRINEARFGMSRDEVHKILKEGNVITRKYFYPLCSEYPCYKNAEDDKSDALPIAKAVVREILCLPLYGDLGKENAKRIAQMITALQNKRM